MAKKHEYIYILNEKPSENESYTCKCGNTKDVKVFISKNGIAIKALIGKEYEKEKLLAADCYLFPNIIKKSLLIYLIKYSEMLDVKTIKVIIDNENIYFGKNDVITSLIENKLERKFSSNWDNACVLQGLLSQKKSYGGNELLASIYALAYSKNKKNEIERFQYLWMSLNGMYNFLGSQINSILLRKFNIKGDTGDKCYIEYMLRYYNMADKTLDQTSRQCVTREVIPLLKDVKGIITKESLKGEHKELAQEIENIISKDNKSNLNAYSYLLLAFSYNFRCSMFHANRPISLFSYADDYVVKCFKIINCLLEDFLEEKLWKFFADDYDKSSLKLDIENRIDTLYVNKKK